MAAEAADSTSLSLDEAMRELRDAVELREAEHARRNRNRVLFTRGVTLFFLGIIFGLILLGRVFDRDLFQQRLITQIEPRVPAVLRNLRDSMARLGPTYRAEVARTLPTFSRNVTTAIGDEAGRLRPAVVPIISGDISTTTDAADQAFATDLLERFDGALGRDPARALALAKTIRAEELKGGRPAQAVMLGASLPMLSEVSDALHGLGLPDPVAFQGQETIDAIGTSALDGVTEKLLSGEFRTSGKSAGREAKP